MVSSNLVTAKDKATRYIKTYLGLTKELYYVHTKVPGLVLNVTGSETKSDQGDQILEG